MRNKPSVNRTTRTNGGATGRATQRTRRIYNAAIPYTPGVNLNTLKLDASIQKFTTTVTTGVIAQSIAIQTGAIANFNSRFGTAFDECRIVKCIFKFYPCSSSNPGVINVWVEPKANATPTSNLSLDNKTVSFAAGSNDRVSSLVYDPTDFADLDWVSVSSTTSVVGYLNVYTDNATYASSIVATDYVVCRAIFVVQFRGLA